MTIHPTELPGLLRIVPFRARDDRGSFVKTFEWTAFKNQGLTTDFREEYYSVSGPRVLRGMHFQLPPHAHVKLVGCTAGRVLDAVIDLRADSPAWRRYATFELSGEEPEMLYIPPGMAHGFYVLEAPATMFYKVSSEYSREHDCGVLWNSAGIPWPDASPVISSRDRAFGQLSDFSSVFRLQ